MISIRNFTEGFFGDDAYQSISPARKVNGGRLDCGIAIQEYGGLRFQFSNCFSGIAEDRYFSRQNDQDGRFG